jgi:hypothetical protein
MARLARFEAIIVVLALAAFAAATVTSDNNLHLLRAFEAFGDSVCRMPRMYSFDCAVGSR